MNELLFIRVMIATINSSRLTGLRWDRVCRYSPAQRMGACKSVITGSPEHKHISKSFVER